MRQFGMQQPIPGPVMQLSNIHDLTLKGKEGKNWMRLIQPALNEWNSRYERRVEIIATLTFQSYCAMLLKV